MPKIELADPWLIFATPKLKIGGIIKCVGFKQPTKSGPSRVSAFVTEKEVELLQFATEADAKAWITANQPIYWKYHMTPVRKAETVYGGAKCI
jgi:hypothetical protein